MFRRRGSISHGTRKVVVRAETLASVLAELSVRSRRPVIVHAYVVAGGASSTTVGPMSRFAITSFHQGVHYLANSLLNHRASTLEKGKRHNSGRHVPFVDLDLSTRRRASRVSIVEPSDRIHDILD